MHRYGHGPNWRMRATRAALDALGFKADMLRHGIQRQVFISFLAKNAKEILLSGKGEPDVNELLSVAEIGRLARERWMVPRSNRRPEFRQWDISELAELYGGQSEALTHATLEYAERFSANSER